MKYKIHITLLLLILPLIIFSCDKIFFHPDTVFYTISPSQYLAQEAETSWICEYADAKGNIISIQIDKLLTDIIIEAPIHCVFPVRLRLNDSLSIRERIVINQNFGLIFPFSEKMNASDSAASEVFFKILTCSKSSSEQAMNLCSRFNWQRLLNSLSRYTDPYSCNLDRAAADIAQGIFTSKSL